MGNPNSAMQAFVFDGEAVRFVGTADAPEWVAADVCTVLGIAEAPSVLRDFEDDERGLRSMQGADGRPRDMLTVTEPGLYRLVFRSRKPDAVRFRRWVTHEVLPAIRRTGSGERRGPTRRGGSTPPPRFTKQRQSGAGERTWQRRSGRSSRCAASRKSESLGGFSA